MITTGQARFTAKLVRSVFKRIIKISFLISSRLLFALFHARLLSQFPDISRVKCRRSEFNNTFTINVMVLTSPSDCGTWRRTLVYMVANAMMSTS